MGTWDPQKEEKSQEVPPAGPGTGSRLILGWVGDSLTICCHFLCLIMVGKMLESRWGYNLFSMFCNLPRVTLKLRSHWLNTWTMYATTCHHHLSICLIGQWGKNGNDVGGLFCTRLKGFSREGVAGCPCKNTRCLAKHASLSLQTNAKSNLFS